MSMEEQLIEQLQLFRVLMDNIPNPVYYKNVDGVYLGYNKAFQEFFGLKHAFHVSKTVFDLPISNDEAILHHQKDVQPTRQSGSINYETPVTCPNKPIRYIILKKSVFNKTDGSLGGIIGVITDITNFKKTEEALKESKARFEDLSKVSFEAVIFLENGVITDVNRRFNELFGYDNSEIVGKTGLDIVVPEPLTASMNITDVENGKAYETIGQKKDGTTFPIEIHTRELNIRGKGVKIYVIIDLTEQKNME